MPGDTPQSNVSTTKPHTTRVGSPQLQPQVSKAQLHFSICARRTFPPLFKASQAQQRSLTTRLWLEAVIGQRNS